MARRSPASPGTSLDRASTIPARWYFDPEHHRRELDLVFERTWQHVARADRLEEPGDYVAAEVAGEAVLVVRGRDRVLRAFHNVCRHRAGLVATGAGCAKALSCTYHGWTYGLDGALLAAPEMEGVKDFREADFGLVAVRCEAWGPFLFVNLDQNAAPLSEALGVLPRLAEGTALAAMRFGVRETYDIACNWKTYVDNYLEGYHVPKAHPGLNKVLDYRRYWVKTEGPLVIQGSPGRDTRAGEQEGYLYVWAWPNFMLNVSPDYAQTNRIVPAGPERTICVFDYWFPAGGSKAAEARRRKSIAWSDGIQKEDVWICETVQRNLHSRSYRAGRYSAKRENGVYHFHEMLRRALA